MHMNVHKDDVGRIVQIVEFTVRNDKFRGILLEKFAAGDNEYFFKYHDRPIHRHCNQMQRIVRVADVKRSKKIRVDVVEFVYEYFLNGRATFKGCPLNSINQQIAKVCDFNLNKEVGIMKRSATIAQNKPRKILERNSKILTKMEEAEKYFQEQRAIRLHELFGRKDSGTPRGPTAPQSPGAHGKSSLRGPTESRVPVGTVLPQGPVAPTLQGSLAEDNDFPMDDDDF